jgi:thymidylate kinase
MIILEGVDKSGKSTLAKRIATARGIKIKKFGIPHGNPVPILHHGITLYH